MYACVHGIDMLSYDRIITRALKSTYPVRCMAIIIAAFLLERYDWRLLQLQSKAINIRERVTACAVLTYPYFLSFFGSQAQA